MKNHKNTYRIIGLGLTAAGLFVDFYFQIINWLVWLLIIIGAALFGGSFKKSE
jgi:hypothetical protein